MICNSIQAEMIAFEFTQEFKDNYNIRQPSDYDDAEIDPTSHQFHATRLNVIVAGLYWLPDHF